VVEVGVLLLGRHTLNLLLALPAALDGVDALLDEALDAVAVLAALLALDQFLQSLDAVDVLEFVGEVSGAHLRRVEVLAVLGLVLAELLDAGLDELFRAGAVLPGFLRLEDVLEFVDVLDVLYLGTEFGDVVVVRVERHCQSPRELLEFVDDLLHPSSSRASTIVASRSAGAFGIGSTPETMVGEPPSRPM